MSWVRLWTDMPTDPKWRVIARRAGRPLSEVIAVFVFMMTNAGANATERGELFNWSDEDVAAALDTEAEHVAVIREAMQGKTLDGDKLSGWETRQPRREDNSAERAKAWREKQKAAQIAQNENERNRTQPNAEERPDADAETDKSRARKRASRLPNNWTLPKEFRDYALSVGLTDAEATKQGDKMLNWSLSAPTGAKLDWFATWRNWISDAPKQGTAKIVSGGAPVPVWLEAGTDAFETANKALVALGRPPKRAMHVNSKPAPGAYFQPPQDLLPKEGFHKLALPQFPTQARA